MRLYPGQFGLISREVIKALLDDDLIEVASDRVAEAELDVEGVLKEYRREDRELTERAKDRAMEDGGRSHFKIKRRLAKERNFRIGDDAIGFIANQIIETFMHSANIEEIYGEDRELRARIVPVLKKYTASSEEEVDKEVRSRLKNLEEGSTTWDIEYERMQEAVRKRRGLE